MSVIAVGDMDPSAVGALVYWRLSGATILSRLAAAWSAAGLPEDMLPSETGPELAASRAVTALKRPGRLVTRLKAKVPSWAVIDQKVREDDVDHNIECRVRFDKWIKVEPSWHPLANEVEVAFNQYLRELTHEDMRNWLVRRLKRLNATSLRDTGGIYFIPRFSYRAWRQVVDAVRASTGHTICEIPAMDSEEAISSIILAVTEEANESAEALSDQIATGDHGKRWLEARANKCRQSLDKIAQYERLLGRKMDDLKEKVDRIHGELVAAALAAQAEEDEKEDAA